ncbi:MAG: histidinol-phosphate transaminase [Novosphingobium sp. 17-62-19]|uniref:histidinol-phosphate transaminase n=1 Tax=Novosphingobium sp. 17-62-19 TaxID=1970406 RepID=UPI000BD4884B|nr:histidinol-phosphate transaminase [Novosphingobium sp. 17-62-19]OZA21218.1 MAG: histidinol-phosphate transaminase [Novosphingobium sp. 17-62-19]HQS95179.1 histidinol-phosphate transaminase [Novosphingobium sp.]
MENAPQTPSAPEPKSWITGIHAYVPGKSTGKDGQKLTKLSANENPLGTSGAALAARAQAVHPATYPDPDSTALRTAIAQVHGLDPARIVMGTGSDELLNLAAQAYAGPGDEVVYVRYGFSVYDIAARRCGATPVVAPDTDYGTDVDALLACVTERTRVVFLANPNNPTGSWLPRAEIARLHAALRPDILLVLDGAYAEYVAPEHDDGALDLATTAQNVLATRTFSKIYGLAGERIGWGTAHPAIIDMLNRIRGPFNISLTGQAAGLAAVQDQAFVESSRRHNAQERARFVEKLEALGNHGVRPLPSQANFVLILFEGALSAEQVYTGLMDHGYITRWLPGQGLPQALRITIGTAAQMDEIAAAIRQMCESAK